eukprot:1194837-Prorocentrum_minimum.AAC.1
MSTRSHQHATQHIEVVCKDLVATAKVKKGKKTKKNGAKGGCSTGGFSTGGARVAGCLWTTRRLQTRVGAEWERSGSGVGAEWERSGSRVGAVVGHSPSDSRTVGQAGPHPKGS